MPATTHSQVAVIGAGVSGLATAWRFLQRQGPGASVTVLEAGPRPGGTMWTNEVDGYRLESGPNGFLTNKPGTLRLCEDLGLGEALLKSSDAARKRYVYARGELHLLPSSPPAFLRSSLLSRRGRLRVMGEVLTRAPERERDESLASFGRRHLGEEATSLLLDPMVSGIYAGDPEQLSVGAAFPRIRELERDHGSLIRAMLALKRSGSGGGGGPSGPGGVLTSLERGMGQLIETLFAQLGGERVRCNTPVRELRREGDAWQIQTAGGTHQAEQVVLTIPGWAGVKLLGGTDAALAETFEAMPYAAINVLGLGFDAGALGHPLDGFGFLCPHREGRRILGCLWSSSVYPGHRAPDGKVLMRVMLGGARRPELAELDDAALQSLVREELGQILKLPGGRAPAPEMFRVIRWPRGIPQYNVGHLARVRAAEARLRELPGLHLAGNAWYGVAVNDCAARAEAVADALSAAC